MKKAILYFVFKNREGAKKFASVSGGSPLRMVEKYVKSVVEGHEPLLKMLIKEEVDTAISLGGRLVFAK